MWRLIYFHIRCASVALQDLKPMHWKFTRGSLFQSSLYSNFYSFNSSSLSKYRCLHLSAFYMWDASWKHLGVGGVDSEGEQNSGSCVSSGSQRSRHPVKIKCARNSLTAMPVKGKKEESGKVGKAFTPWCMSDPCEVGRVSDFRPVLRWFQPGWWGVLEPTSPGWGVPCRAMLRNPILLSHWLGAAHGKHSHGTYVTVDTEGQRWRLQTIILPWKEV